MVERAADPSESIARLQARAVRAFAHRFGRCPTFTAVAPGRINLIGEHTDYNDGFALPMAIDLAAMVVADRAGGARSRLVALDLDESASIELAQAHLIHPDDDTPEFARHVGGVAGSLARRGLAPPELDLLLTSDVPIGAGLASSAAIEVAASLVFEQAVGVELDARSRTEICVEAEHEAVGAPCGIMDMLVSFRGQRGHALLIDCRSGGSQSIPLPARDRATIMMIGTGVHHSLAGSAYADRRRTCESAARKLGVSALRDATLAMLSTDVLNEIEQKRAAHVISENTRTLLAASALREGQLEVLIDLLFASHDSLRDLFAVSCPELDTIVDAARDLRDRGMPIGARMTGGGFGGSAIVLCPPDHAEEIAREIIRAFAGAHGVEPTVRRVEASDGARVLPVPGTR